MFLKIRDFLLKIVPESIFIEYEIRQGIFCPLERSQGRKNYHCHCLFIEVKTMVFFSGFLV